MTFLSVSRVTRKFDRHVAVKDVTFEQRRHQKVAVAGETGSGKSTLLKIIAGLVQPSKGQVLFEGSRVQGPEETLVPGHPGIAYLSQHFELPKFLRVGQVLEYANMLSEKEAGDLFSLCQINHLLERKTDQLSGGEKQRIAICRLLIGSPRLLLLDEPFAHLDIAHRDSLQRVINDIGNRLKITVTLVSHDPADLLSWADKIVVLRAGRVIQKGTPVTLYHLPADEYVAGLFGHYNVLNRSQAEQLGIKGKRKLLVRPEHLRLTLTGSRNRAGVVDQVQFIGTHSVVEVTFSGARLITHTDRNGLSPGDRVYVSLDKRIFQ